MTLTLVATDELPQPPKQVKDLIHADVIRLDNQPYVLADCFWSQAREDYRWLMLKPTNNLDKRIWKHMHGDTDVEIIIAAKRVVDDQT